MRSIFLGDAENIRRVYAEKTAEKLKKEAALDIDRIYSEEELGEGFEDVDYIFSTWGMADPDAETIRRVFPSLKAVFYAAGSVQGFARPFLECGVEVFSAWAANGVPVCEFAVSEIILANKLFYRLSALYSAGKFDEACDVKCGMVGNYDCKVGLIGAGMIGRMVAERLKSYNLDVLVFDPFVSDETLAEIGAERASLERIFSECLTVSNHLANNAQTRGMLGYDLFKLMPKNATFINTGRGAQVVEEDLIRILKERADLTAVLDVTFPEPPLPESKFYTLPNCVLTPHIAGSLGNEKWRMSEYMYDEFIRYKNGEKTLYGVTEKMLETMA